MSEQIGEGPGARKTSFRPVEDLNCMVRPEGQEGCDPRVLWSQPPEEPCRPGRNLGLLPKTNRKHLKSLGKGETQSNLHF